EYLRIHPAERPYVLDELVERHAGDGSRALAPVGRHLAGDAEQARCGRAVGLQGGRERERDQRARAVAEEAVRQVELAANRLDEGREQLAGRAIRLLADPLLAPGQADGADLDLRREDLRPGPEDRRAGAGVAEAEDP